MSDDRRKPDPDDHWDDEPWRDGWGPEITQDLGSDGSSGAWGSQSWSSEAGQHDWAPEDAEQDQWSPDATSGPETSGDTGAGDAWDARSWEEGGQQPWSAGGDAGWEQRSWGVEGDQSRWWDAQDEQQWVSRAEAEPWAPEPVEQEWSPASNELGTPGSAGGGWEEPSWDPNGAQAQPWDGDSGQAWYAETGGTQWEQQDRADEEQPLPAAEPDADAQGSWEPDLAPQDRPAHDADPETWGRDTAKAGEDVWDSEDATLPPTPFETIAPHLKGAKKGEATGRRRSPRLILIPALAIVLLAGLAVAEALVLPPAERVAAPVPQEGASVGLWYCPVVAGDGEQSSLAVAPAGDQASRVTVVRHTPEGPVSGSPQQVDPGTQLDVPLQTPEPLSVRWSGGPSVVTWRVNGEESAAASCVAGPSPTWYLAGLDTAAGAQSTLHLFNPFPADAVARVVFTTPEGPVTLVRTDNILVRGGESIQLNLGEFQPEVADLGVIVEVQAGRLVAQGEVTHDPIEGETGPKGRTLVPAAAAPSDFWAFGYARVDDNSSSWLDIQNPGEREAAVDVRVSAPAASGSLLGEVAVPAGGTARIDLADVSEDAEFGVAVDVVNDVPVVAARMAALRTGEGREGVATSLGAEPATEWALAGAGSGGLSSRLGLYNPGIETISVAVEAGPDTPEEWGDVAVEPNARVQLELSDVAPGQEGVPLRITSDGPVLPELRSIAEDSPLRSWTALAAPAASWAGPGTRPPVRRDPALPSVPLVSAERSGDPAIDSGLGR